MCAAKPFHSGARGAFATANLMHHSHLADGRGSEASVLVVGGDAGRAAALLVARTGGGSSAMPAGQQTVTIPLADKSVSSAASQAYLCRDPDSPRFSLACPRPARMREGTSRTCTIPVILTRCPHDDTRPEQTRTCAVTHRRSGARAARCSWSKPRARSCSGLRPQRSRHIRREPSSSSRSHNRHCWR